MEFAEFHEFAANKSDHKGRTIVVRLAAIKLFRAGAPTYTVVEFTDGKTVAVAASYDEVKKTLGMTNA